VFWPNGFILASSALLYYTFAGNLLYSSFGTLVILAGVPVYYAFSLRRSPAAEANQLG
jgi:hypothetical protein